MGLGAVRQTMAESDPGDLRVLSRDDLEARIRERTAYLQDVMDTMVDVLVRTDARGRIEMTNDAVDSRLGYDPASLEGKPIDVLLAPEEAADAAAGSLVDRLLADGAVTDLELPFETADGATVPMSVSASLTTDEAGEVTGLVCVAKDVSERRDARETADFLHSLLRHDLGNTLQVTGGYLDLVDDDALPERDANHLEKARSGIEDAADLIESVRILEQADGDEELTPRSLPAVVSEVVDRHRGLAERHDVTVETDVPDASVVGGRLLPELFANLLENALKHAGGSTVTVTGSIDDETVTVSVADDGEGIPPEERDRIFEKGVSAGEEAGSGLGMYLVGRLAETYGATVEVGESPAGGAQFDVEFRRAEAAD